MEPFDFKVHEVTFDDKRIQEADLDSFSNVIHYDSALIDLTTGKHTDSPQVSDSSTFACKFRDHSRIIIIIIVHCHSSR